MPDRTYMEQWLKQNASWGIGNPDYEFDRAATYSGDDKRMWEAYNRMKRIDEGQYYKKQVEGLGGIISQSSIDPYAAQVKQAQDYYKAQEENLRKQLQEQFQGLLSTTNSNMTQAQNQVNAHIEAQNKALAELQGNVKTSLGTLTGYMDNLKNQAAKQEQKSAMFYQKQAEDVGAKQLRASTFLSDIVNKQRTNVKYMR